MKINGRVLIMREAVVKLVGMLAQKDVKVTQRGTRAYVDYNPKTLEPRRVNIPYMPDDASDELLDAIQGFLDHEVAHILFTDATVLVEAKKVKLGRLHNIIEDAFIEKKMTDHFAGSGLNLRNVGHFFLKTYTDKKIAEDPKNINGVLIVPAIRAWSGQQTYIDYMHDKWHLIQPIVDALGPDISDILKNVKSSQDGLNAAIEIKRRLDAAKDARAKTAGDGNGSENDQDDDDKKEKEKKEGKESKEGKGSKKKEKKSSSEKEDKGESSDSSEGSDDDNDGGAEEGDDLDLDGGDEGDKEEKSTPSDGDDKSEGEEKKDGEENNKGESQDEGENKDEGGSSGDCENKADGDGGKKDGKSGDKGGDGKDSKKDDSKAGDSSSEGDAGSGDSKDGKGDKSKDGGSGEAGDSDQGANPGETDAPLGKPKRKGPPAPSSDELEGMMGSDFDDALAEEISKQSKMEAKDSEYMVYTKDFDKVEPLAKRGVPPHILEQLQNNVDHLVGSMQKGLERAIAARSAATWTGGHRKGRLHAAGLTRLNFGDDRVFRRKHVNFTKDVAVSLVCDLSGSMSQDGKMQTAGYAAYGLSSVLERMGINHEVIGFTTLPIDIESSAAYEELTEVNYARNEALYMPIIKGWGERLNSEVKERFALLSADITSVMRENVDGECVQIAGMRLRSRREARKVMIVLSDGQPACGGMRPVLAKHLKDSVAELSKMDITVVGIGIKTEAVKKFYPKNVVIQNVSELPGVVMGELRRLLIQ